MNIFKLNKKKAINKKLTTLSKLWHTQVDIIRTLFTQHREEIEDTFRISKKFIHTLKH